MVPFVDAVIGLQIAAYIVEPVIIVGLCAGLGFAISAWLREKSLRQETEEALQDAELTLDRVEIIVQRTEEDD